MEKIDYHEFMNSNKEIVPNTERPRWSRSSIFSQMLDVCGEVERLAKYKENVMEWFNWWYNINPQVLKDNR